MKMRTHRCALGGLASALILAACGGAPGESTSMAREEISPAPTASPSGDVNGDGCVDIADLSLVLAAWGPSTGKTPAPEDLNGDGVVDSYDLNIVLATWGQGCVVPGSPDLNGDGCVDQEDLQILLDNWGGSGTGDINQDGVVDTQDLNLLLAAFGEGC